MLEKLNLKEREIWMAIYYKQCPKCGTKNTVKILYGMPTQEAFQKAEAGEIKLGGCSITESDPEYYCKDCQNEWSREQAINTAYAQIKGIKATVGGFFDGFYKADINLTNLQISWSHSLGGEVESIQKTISPATANHFIEELKMLNLLNWKAKYIEPFVLDGTQWRVEIIREGRNISKHGDNKYPEEWGMFCKLIGKFTGKSFS